MKSIKTVFVIAKFREFIVEKEKNCVGNHKFQKKRSTKIIKTVFPIAKFGENTIKY